VLVEKDWTGFGHMFAKRGGSEGTHETSPIFLQWLDCVFQLTVQFPDAFEFNEDYLLYMADQVCSGRAVVQRCIQRAVVKGCEGL
jgi:myotubularin-related protein 1/2